MMNRAPLNLQLTQFLPAIEQSFLHLQELIRQAGGELWYPSLVVERRWKRQFVINPKGEDLSESLNLGWVMRVFNGETLFEQAGDQFEEEVLKAAAKTLIQQVERAKKPSSPQTYVSPSWAERLKYDLEEELVLQIPTTVSQIAGHVQWVHFGVPRAVALPASNADLMNFAKNGYLAWQSNIESEHKDISPLDFSAYRLSLEEVGMVFIDASVRMTQTLQRNSSTLIGLKDGKQTFVLKGGLGGQETVEVGKTEFDEVMHRLKRAVKAERIKPGRYKVLMAPSVTGVFAHEAFGHSQEADTWARGRSKAKELYDTQQRVGNDYANIVNNPAVYVNGADQFGAWGSYYFDEEGWLAQKHSLVEKGYLKTPMTNLVSALRLKIPRTANGKRENWTHGIYARQTNTYFEPGEETLDEVMKKIDYGFLATTPFGGMEDPKGMGIQVGMAYVEEIKDGQLTGKSFVAPNGGAIQMTGYVPDYLNQILAVSKTDYLTSEPDKSVHPWNEVGGCGKYHKEFVEAGCGGPYLLVDQVLLG